MRQRSCGLLVESPEGWLLAHATDTPRWDLPKGRMEPRDASPMAAALRECYEETGFDFSCYAHELEDLGCHAYLNHKDLHLFRLRVPQAMDLSGCCCSTYAVRRSGEHVLETDRWAWVPPEQLDHYVGPSLIRYLDHLDRLQLVVMPRPSLAHHS